MRLQFRRNINSCFALLAFGSLSINCHPSFGQENRTSRASSNTLRPVDPAGTSKPASPAEPVDPNFPTNPVIDGNRTDFQLPPSSSDTDSVLVIGSASTRLASADDSAFQLFAIENTLSESDAEVAIASCLAMKIATATMSHSSPFFWWMAGPTTNLIPADTLEEEPIEDGSLEPKLVANETMELNDSVGHSHGKTGIGEPPRMKQLVEAPKIEPSKSTPAETSTNESKLSPDAEIAEPAPRKPTPRAVRMPFEKDPIELKTDVAEPAMRNPASIAGRDKDSQRDQEEPQLDPRGLGNERDQQGIDALLASKPIANRREIRIDDPSNEGMEIAPIVQGKPADPVLAKRLQRTEACLSYYLNNPESTSVRSPWAVMHALLAFGSDYEMVHGQGRVNAIGWMCHNGTCRTQRIFTPTAVGFKPNVGGGVQGHDGQFLAILAQSNVPLNYPIQVGSAKYTVEDLVRQEMATCKEKSELTFKLIGLSYYLDSNKQWRSNDGKAWSIPKLIQEELAQPIIGASCGGVHRLMGYSFSVRQRQLQGQPVNGQYARAAKFVRDYVNYTWQLQNPDGSFSTNWYEGRANEPNDERKVQTSGHMLEWLMFTLSDAEMKDPRAGKAVDFLLNKIYDRREHKWPIGPRGHATRAVALYQERTKEVLSLPSQPNRNAQTNSATQVSPAPTRK